MARLLPVRKNQRAGSALKRSAYCDNTAGVSRSGSTLMETKRRSAMCVRFDCSRAISEVISGHSSGQLVKIKLAIRPFPSKSPPHRMPR
jgi:hypothetical protein